VNILGISAFYHDSAACLVQDGRIVAAAQEERFTRKKHDERFPAHAAAYCAREAGVELSALDYVAFYDKPLLKFDRLLETYLAYAPAGFAMFRRAMPAWLGHKLHVPRELDRGLRGAYRGRYLFTEHHESHAASAFFPSPFEEAAILTLDGAGEWATGSVGVGRGGRIALRQELRFPHSLGLLYSAFTYFCGFRVNSGEYKLMGLAPYGEPIYADLIRERLIDLKPDGSFRLDMRYFAYGYGATMTSRRMDALFGGPPRAPEAEITQREMDIAASIQAVTDEVVLRIAAHARATTGMAKLVMAGGVALNGVAAGKLLRAGIFDDVWIQPAAGDAGGALGAALFVWHQLLGNARAPAPHDAQRGSLLGPAFSAAEVQAALDAHGAVYHRYDDERALCEVVAERLAAGDVVGHMAGRMEFGPRALGNRSILADARAPDMQARLNQKIKFRESFRPFAPAVLREHAARYVELPEGKDSPYMLFVVPLAGAQRIEPNTVVAGFDRLRAVRSRVPAVTHVDGSARVQTVDAERNPRLHALLSRFYERTGCPLVINTSFNVRGEPLVHTPADALRCFLATGMDALVIEDFVLYKREQPAAAAVDPAAHLAAFAPD
jgi:carbamoyltransferase